MEKNIFKIAAQEIKSSDGILIATGAGMGVDSGLPDFRGVNGFWKAYPPIAKLGLRFEEMANPYWFDKNPLLAWAFYGHRYNLYKKTTPHKGFDILSDWAKKKNSNYFVITSNVDGHFQKAGFDDNKIYEIHGSINYLQCSIPCKNEYWKNQTPEYSIDEDKFELSQEIPKCKFCGNTARPNILMFGDWNWVSLRYSEQETKYADWLGKLKNQKLVIIEIGAGKAVPSIRLNSERLIHQLNAKLIRINPRDFEIPNGHISIATGGLDALEKINELI